MKTCTGKKIHVF